MSPQIDHSAQRDDAMELGEAGNAKAELAKRETPKLRSNATKDEGVNPLIKSVHSPELAQRDDDGDATATVRRQGGADDFGGGQSEPTETPTKKADDVDGGPHGAHDEGKHQSNSLSVTSRDHDELPIFDFRVLARLNIRILEAQLMEMDKKAFEGPHGGLGVDPEQLTRSLHAYSEFLIPKLIRFLLISDTSRCNQRLRVHGQAPRLLPEQFLA